MTILKITQTVKQCVSGIFLLSISQCVGMDESQCSPLSDQVSINQEDIPIDQPPTKEPACETADTITKSSSCHEVTPEEKMKKLAQLIAQIRKKKSNNYEDHSNPFLNDGEGCWGVNGMEGL